MIDQFTKLIEAFKTVDSGLAAVIVVGLGFVVLIMALSK